MNSRFNGQIEKALSAYNAGYSKVRKWEKQYAHVDDPHLFLSLIPYRETRNYAISIFRNIYWYRTLYPALRNKAEQSSLGMKLSTICNHHSSNQKKVSAVTYPEKIVKSIEYQTHPKKSSVTSETSGP